MEPEEIQKRLTQFQGELGDLKIIGYILCPAMVVWFAYWLIFTQQPIITRASLLLIVLGMGFWVGQIWLYNRDHQNALAHSDAAGQTSCLEFYRDVLVRRRNFHRGGWFWSRLFALYAGLSFAMWEPLHHWHGRGNAPRSVNLLVISILAIVTVWLSYRKSRKLQQNIDAIDAMKQADGEGSV
jgi:cbb3-type cytochrome oxidase subunit 3